MQTMERIVRQLLQAARELGGEPPSARHVASAKVVRCALAAAGELSAADRRYLAERGDGDGTAAARYYDVLMRLVNGVSWTESYLDGAGNFGAVCYGHPDYPPAHPRYTTCRISARGLQYLLDVTAIDEALTSQPGGGA
ncbi:MAG: hypothetical protein U0736_06865 [Gemmataceae bacterium]